VATPAEASAWADVIMVLAPDTAQRKIYAESIAPNLTAGKMLMFAHGFNIRFKGVVPPKNVDVTMVARNRRVGKHPPMSNCAGRPAAAAYPQSEIAGLQPECCIRAVFGPPGGARAAHIMQFRPVGVECLGEELPQEGLESGKGVGRSSAADNRGGERGRRNRCHDAVSLFSRGAFPRGTLFQRQNESWLDLLKDGFNCRDLPHTGYRTRIHAW